MAVAVDGGKAVQPPNGKTWRREANNNTLGAPQTCWYLKEKRASGLAGVLLAQQG